MLCTSRGFLEKVLPIVFLWGVLGFILQRNPGHRVQTLLAIFSPASNHRTGFFNGFSVVVLAAGENPAGPEALEISVLKVRSARSSTSQLAASGPC